MNGSGFVFSPGPSGSSGLSVLSSVRFCPVQLLLDVSSDVNLVSLLDLSLFSLDLVLVLVRPSLLDRSLDLLLWLDRPLTLSLDRPFSLDLSLDLDLVLLSLPGSLVALVAVCVGSSSHLEASETRLQDGPDQDLV